MLRASRDTPDRGEGGVHHDDDLDLRNRSAVLDSEHVGDIRGALGTIRLDDTAPRRGRSAVLKTLLAIVGPGLIVMVGDNDAGAFATYGQAGQNYGTKLLWTLLLLVPVLYVNQEMVLRLGAVTGVGHARLILERFGKFWGAFSVIDLFILNALTIVTEFIGITLARRIPGRSEDRRRRTRRRSRGRLGLHRQLPPVRADRGGVLRGQPPAHSAVLHGSPARQPDGA